MLVSPMSLRKLAAQKRTGALSRACCKIGGCWLQWARPACAPTPYFSYHPLAHRHIKRTPDMFIRAQKGLTFDDVLLAPKRSPIASRRDVDTSTRLTTAIRLNIPILSANMDTVTEAGMAIAMAQNGGIGVLHRFMTVEQQVRQVRK